MWVAGISSVMCSAFDDTFNVSLFIYFRMNIFEDFYLWSRVVIRRWLHDWLSYWSFLQSCKKLETPSVLIFYSRTHFCGFACIFCIHFLHLFVCLCIYLLTYAFFLLVYAFICLFMHVFVHFLIFPPTFFSIFCACVIMHPPWGPKGRGVTPIGARQGWH